MQRNHPHGSAVRQSVEECRGRSGFNSFSEDIMSNTRSVAQSGVSSVASIYMRQVYQWMTMGLGVTTLMAWFVASTPAVQQVIFGN